MKLRVTSSTRLDDLETRSRVSTLEATHLKAGDAASFLFKWASRDVSGSYEALGLGKTTGKISF